MLKGLFNFTLGVALGAAVGLVAARLLAPASGEEMVQSLREYRDGVIQAGKEAEEQRRIELESRLVQIKRSRLGR